jgi:predicted alpha/beta hydrolase
MTGHGGSDGLHGYVPSLDYVIEDIEVLLNKIMMENPGVPCFLLGHSTGGAVVLKVRSYEIEQCLSTLFRPGLDTDPISLGL